MDKKEAIKVLRDILNRDKYCKTSLSKIVEDADLNSDGVLDKQELFKLFIKSREELPEHNDAN